MKTVLMVAEKPSLAQSIANILSKKSCEYRKGFNGACAVNEWQGKFPPTSETVRLERQIETFIDFHLILWQVQDDECLWSRYEY